MDRRVILLSVPVGHGELPDLGKSEPTGVGNSISAAAWRAIFRSLLIGPRANPSSKHG